jgi:enediyne polyketide synthase
MGARLGAVETLRRRGVMPLSPDDAVAMAYRLATSCSGNHVMVTGRLGDLPTFRFGSDESRRLLRFVEDTRVSVRGVEVVADARLSELSDPYVGEHIVEGRPLVPAVIGMEAMAQVAVATTGAAPTKFINLRLTRPIVVPGDQTTVIRVASLTEGRTIEVVVRSSESSFAFDHFRSTVVSEPLNPVERVSIPPHDVDVESSWVYDHLLFHQGRFRRVTRYRTIAATRCVADIAPDPAVTWFHRYLPSSFLLGDPALRDAAIHALQACIPQAVVLPEAVGRIELFEPPVSDVVVIATEVAREDRALVFDLDLLNPDGRVLERWRQLRLHIVARRRSVHDLPPALWAAFLEREVAHISMRIVQAGSDWCRPADRSAAPVARRSDGKPLAPEGYVSVATSRDLRLTVLAKSPVGCDLQAVDGYPWGQLTNPQDTGLIGASAADGGDDIEVASARVWSARESLKKLSGNPMAPLVFEAAESLGRVNYRSGATSISTFILGGHVVAFAWRGQQEPFVESEA